MSEVETGTALIVTARYQQQTYGPYHPLHGTPNSMLWRKVTIETPRGMAAFEQTDYGHPGRMNPWEPRGVAPALTGKLAQLQAVAEALVAVEV